MAQEGRVEIPTGLLRRLIGLTDELAGYVPSAVEVETVHVPGNGEWSRDMLEDLRRQIEGYKGALALLDLAAKNTGSTIRYSQVQEAAGVPDRQIRADLAGMTRASRRLFGERKWPLRAWQASDGEMSYEMQEKIALWWLDHQRTVGRDDLKRIRESLDAQDGPRVPVDREKVEDFCKKWKVEEFSFFGSVLTDDFGPDSDVDVLVTFAEDAGWSLFDLIDAEDELESIFGRDVDLVTRRSIERSENWIRRKAILESAEPYLAQR